MANCDYQRLHEVTSLYQLAISPHDLSKLNRRQYNISSSCKIAATFIDFCEYIDQPALVADSSCGGS